MTVERVYTQLCDIERSIEGEVDDLVAPGDHVRSRDVFFCLYAIGGKQAFQTFEVENPLSAQKVFFISSA